MIEIAKIYQATDKGKDIILMLYPQASVCFDDKDNKKKKFALRNERTPSAVVYPPDTKHDYYRVVDFGDNGHPLSPVDLYMKEKGIGQNRFNEAVLQLAAQFNVTDELNKSVNKPRIEKRDRKENENEGDRPFKLMNRFPEQHLKVFGPNVKREHVEKLHWAEAEYIGYVNKDSVTLEYSTDIYPIFMRECQTEDGQKFYKIYKPYNPDKQFRFTYAPKGVKSSRFINGLDEIEQELAIRNAELDPDQPEIEKINEAVICSGERDAICCLSMGYMPIWFNSETFDLQLADYNRIMAKVHKLYNIPDIDATGKRKGMELALKYLDIHTIWLPDWLLTYRDNRGRPRKDFRDWQELRPSESDFRNIMKTAMKAKFWEYSTGKSGKSECSISAVRLYYFLRLNGFNALRDEDSDSPRYVRLQGNIVTSVRARDVRKFVREWAEEHFLGEDVRNLIAGSMKFSESALENLKEIELNFCSSTPRSQTMYFMDKYYVITKDKIDEFYTAKDEIKSYVWNENVIKHRVKLLPEAFTAYADNDSFDLTINDTKSPFFGYLINASRLYWRKEMEERFKTEEERRQYREANKFRIDGEGLTDEEIAEQKQNLLNKLFTIGYMMHRYKSPSRPWAPVALDGKIGDADQCNGRSGKSFIFKTLSMFMKTVTLSGRNPKLMDNPHVFDQVTKHTDMIIVDDCAKYLPMSLFYDNITSDMTVNPKNNQSYTIRFQDSPKFAFSTNYAPTDFDSSSVARSLYVVFSDYYHEISSDNDYLETRHISDDFGGDLYGENYSEELWNADINILMQCLKFYLSTIDKNIKILPPMEKIMMRKNIQDMGANFEEWADFFFSEDSDNVNCEIVRSKAFSEYQIFSRDYKLTMKGFTKKLKAFCVVKPYIDYFNPPEMCNSENRISRRIDGKMEDMIYIRTISLSRSSMPTENPRHPDLFDGQDENEDDEVEPF